MAESLDARDWTWGEEDLPWPLTEVQESIAGAGAVQRLLQPGPKLFAIIQ